MHTSIRCMAVLIVVGCLTSCAGLNFPGSSQSAFEAGLGLFNRGKYEEAIPYFVKATEIDSQFGQAYLYLGRSQLNLQRWSEAVHPLRTAYWLSPEATKQESVQILLDALIGAGNASLAKGDLNDAIQLFRDAQSLAPEAEQVKKSLVDALLQSGTQLLSQGRASQAVLVFQEVTQLAPKGFQGYMRLAQALWQSGNTSKALSAAQSALQLAPNSSEALSAFALLSQLQTR